MANKNRTCSIDGCDKRHFGRGWCNAHYVRWRKTGDPLGTLRKFKPKPKCIIEGCDNDGNSHGFGWCQKHYRRFQRHGSPLATSRVVGDDVARFWSNTSKRDPDECWEWTGGKSPDGYGILRIDGRTAYMPRFAYVLLRDPIPEGLEPDHLCRNRGCVNPWHLEPVTHKVNILRGESPQAINARKTHCIRGHEFTDENTGRDPRGGRFCRTCKSAWEKNRRRKAA